MENTNKISHKKEYSKPEVNKVLIDKNISVYLLSPGTPPPDPPLKSQDTGGISPFA